MAQWHAWSNAAQTPNVSSFDAYPQPMLTDIAFDGDAMVLGMRDRFGDQMGNQAYGKSRYPANTTLMTGLTAGDLLRACPGGWLRYRSQRELRRPPRPRAGNGEGPGGGEFYSTDDELRTTSSASAGLHRCRASTRTSPPCSTRYSPTSSGDSGFNDGGVVWSANATGARARNGFRLYNDDIDPAGSIFGKAHGLGDLELLCDEPPVQIGNRVWLDDGGGSQTQVRRNPWYQGRDRHPRIRPGRSSRARRPTPRASTTSRTSTRTPATRSGSTRPSRR